MFLGWSMEKRLQPAKDCTTKSASLSEIPLQGLDTGLGRAAEFQMDLHLYLTDLEVLL